VYIYQDVEETEIIRLLIIVCEIMKEREPKNADVGGAGSTHARGRKVNLI